MTRHVHAITSGSGPDVVLVHGALGDHRQWTPIAGQLASRYRAHALSRRYHWPNPAPPADAPYSYELHRDDLLDYIRALPGPVHLVGHSYGAGIVLITALREPTLVRTLTIIEPALHSLLPAPTPGLEPELASRSAMVTAVRSLVAAGEHEAAARKMIDWTQGGPGGFSRLAPEVRQALVDNALTMGPTFGTAQPTVTPADLRAVSVPTLVIRGEHTRLYYRLIAETATASLPDVRGAQLAAAGHMTIVEKPAETAALLLRFLPD